ncbi:HdeD family acid-resistance protein [Breznakiella homolactica]|uniref:DUF308 domain-containing protein n=1 Tax=Breznakiella homolactica TaxID=2798577 RepID=A0A7T8BB79_9SPIR|nr:DUF308 domain-containing protein [Breznakiella homolactica]QQO10131.1 DUF308 domain-containing protein [Breznakiella homolactica]
MKNILWRIAWILVGLALIGIGVFFISSPNANLVTLSVLIGIVMLINGIIDIVAYARYRKIMISPGWELAEGIITVIVALVILFNYWVAAAILPFIISVWVLFAGITRTVTSFDLRRVGISSWGWSLFLGIAEIVFAVLSFFNPFVTALTIGLLVGIFFIFQGVTAILKGIFSDKMVL